MMPGGVTRLSPVSCVHVKQGVCGTQTPAMQASFAAQSAAERQVWQRPSAQTSAPVHSADDVQAWQMPSTQTWPATGQSLL
jgi:hypothetical protein